MAKKDGRKEAAAVAAAAAGAAAIGGKLAWDKLAGSDGDQADAYRLRANEPVPDGIRRVARAQLDGAQASIDGASKRQLAPGVHDARKRLKRLRASVRLARAGLGDQRYRGANTTFRDIGRELSGTRDATVMIETLDQTLKAAGDELPPGVAGALRSRLEQERDQALAGLKDDEGKVGKVLGELADARTRTASWRFDGDGFAMLEPGLARIYRRGRKAMRNAEADTSDENLHEWRKRVKDFWHALQLLRPADPKRMKKLASRAHDLSDLLGDDHDLAELRTYVTKHRDQFDGRSGQLALLAVIDRRRRDLQRRAFKLGAKLYGDGPNRFTSGIERGWRKNVGDRAQVHPV
jgi:CHAD domain-containing protein